MCLLPCEDTEQTVLLREQSRSRHWTCGWLDLGVPGLQNCEKVSIVYIYIQFLLFISCPVHGLVL